MQPYPYHIREEYAGEVGYTHWRTKIEAEQVRAARWKNYPSHVYRVSRCNGDHSDETRPDLTAPSELSTPRYRQ